MSVFFSDKSNLLVPEIPHSDDPRYTPVNIGQPLSVELLHLAFGNVKDWWGKAEILVSSWAKIGGTAKPAARVINLMRKGIKEYDHLSDLGAAEYGHQLVYYSPVYNGETLRFSLEFLEIDKLRPSEIEKLGKGLKSIAKLATFAPQLAYLALAPEVLKIGAKLYDTINRNDKVLLEHLDLSFDEVDSKVLSSGRYVLINKNVSSNFTDKFMLDFDNQLKTKKGILAEEAGMKDAYIVIKINASEKNEYKDFVYESQSQLVFQELLNNSLTQNIADTLSETVKSAMQFSSVNDILQLKTNLDKETDATKKDTITKEIETELKKLTDDQATLLKGALGV